MRLPICPKEQSRTSPCRANSTLRETPFQLLDLRFELGYPLVLLPVLLPPSVADSLLEGYRGPQNLLVLSPYLLLLSLAPPEFLLLTVLHSPTRVSEHFGLTKIIGWCDTAAPHKENSTRKV